MSLEFSPFFTQLHIPIKNTASLSWDWKLSQAVKRSVKKPVLLISTHFPQGYFNNREGFDVTPGVHNPTFCMAKRFFRGFNDSPLAGHLACTHERKKLSLCFN